MRISKLLTAIALLPVAAFAQVAPNLTITFVSADVSVPVGAWLPAILATVIGITAFVLRKKINGATGAIAVIAAGALVTGAATQMSDAYALTAVSMPINLVTSPTLTSAASTGGYIATNNSGRTIRLTGVSIGEGCLDISAPTTTCNVGLVMTSGATCTVTLVNASRCT